ncbi:unnamed protein product [Brassica napus]|uniref:(rape) hypothetical protein n=1 Tax=Brassica napus TaxID=3708 RepID=A0A816IQ03_BRANA|nr:unnamed protein product [Brassica napus]
MAYFVGLWFRTITNIYIPFDSKFTDIKTSFAGSLDRDNLFFKWAFFY